MSSKPRTLDELLREYNSFKLDKTLDLDALIKSRTWSQRFVDKYLTPRGLDGLVTALKFMAFTQPIHANAQHLLSAGKSKVKISKAQRKEMTAIVIETAKIFFDYDNDETVISLRNPDVFDEVGEIAARLQKSSKETATDSDLKVILGGRRDVQCDELETHFERFIKTEPDGALACLLSIL